LFQQDLFLTFRRFAPLFYIFSFPFFQSSTRPFSTGFTCFHPTANLFRIRGCTQLVFVSVDFCYFNPCFEVSPCCGTPLVSFFSPTRPLTHFPLQTFSTSPLPVLLPVLFYTPVLLGGEPSSPPLSFVIVRPEAVFLDPPPGATVVY